MFFEFLDPVLVSYSGNSKFVLAEFSDNLSMFNQSVIFFILNNIIEGLILNTNLLYIYLILVLRQLSL